jgi:DUF2934 family protein
MRAWQLRTATILSRISALPNDLYIVFIAGVFPLFTETRMDNVETGKTCAELAPESGLWERCIAPRITENREACIAEAAYFTAQLRGFASGHELDDWLAAENEVDERLAGEGYAY